MKILITGGNGYIAKSLVRGFSDKHTITSVTRNDFDLSDPILTSEWFGSREFDVVIHTAIVGGSRLKNDTTDVVYKNIKMYENLCENRNCFSKLISFGSGAEIFQPTTPYGISKKIIADSIRNTDNFYNLRIFGVFDEDELETRFIKSNIIRYLKKEPMIIHSDKIMDFFYLPDLVSLVDYYINTQSPEKEVNCSYDQKFSLFSLAKKINELSVHQVPIILEEKNTLDFYCGSSNLPIDSVGLLRGIKNTYNKLKQGFIV
jgi:nucleoside-diphosphate-sugar epimerase